MLASERVMAALLSDSMRPDSLTDGERAEVVSSLKAQPYNGPFSPVDVGTWLGCGMEEAEGVWGMAEAHGSPYNVIEMAKARGYAEPPLLSGPSSVTPPKVDASPFVSLYDVTGEGLLDPDPEIIEGVLRERQVMLIAAPPKGGKTWLAVALMWALATGGEWLGARCARTRVVYCNMEVSPASFANRCEAVRGEMGIPHDAARMVDVLSGRGAGYDANRLVEAVLVHLGGTPACVVVDCLYAIETGNENDAEAIRALFAELNRLTRAGCSVVGVHHFPKGSSGMKASVDRMAGSSVFARAPDALLSLDPLDVDPRGEAGAELAEQGYSAYRLSFDLRDFRPRRPIDLIFTGTRFVRDVGGLLGGAYIKGSPQANGAHSGRANAERAEADWKRKAALVGEAVSAAALEGVNPTMEYVRDYYNSHRGGLRAGEGVRWHYRQLDEA